MKATETCHCESCSLARLSVRLPSSFHVVEMRVAGYWMYDCFVFKDKWFVCKIRSFDQNWMKMADHHIWSQLETFEFIKVVKHMQLIAESDSIMKVTNRFNKRITRTRCARFLMASIAALLNATHRYKVTTDHQTPEQNCLRCSSICVFKKCATVTWVRPYYGPHIVNL